MRKICGDGPVKLSYPTARKRPGRRAGGGSGNKASWYVSSVTI